MDLGKLGMQNIVVLKIKLDAGLVEVELLVELVVEVEANRVIL